MTKEELKQLLKSGRVLDQCLPLTNGQECLIYKGDWPSCPTDDIIYIPDVSLNDLLDGADPNDVISCCYTAADFTAMCHGSWRMARELFNYCDWQHPDVIDFLAGIEDDMDDQEFFDTYHVMYKNITGTNISD